MSPVAVQREAAQADVFLAALGRLEGDAGGVAQRVLQRVEVAVVDQLLGDDGDRLRDVAQFLVALADRVVVARTEFWSVSALALTEIGCSIVPSFAWAAGRCGRRRRRRRRRDLRQRRDESRPKPAASAPSGSSGAGRVTRLDGDERMESGKPVSTVLSFR